MTCNEPALHALSVVPRSVRPGDVVRVEFRTPNLGSKASPAGTVAFLVGAGLEALGDVEVGVDSVAPGEDVTAFLSARVATPPEPRVCCSVEAVLRIPGAELATNRCSVEVRSRAIVDGVASGVFLEALDGHSVLVCAVVTNEGDGPAPALRVVVPAPFGCVPCGGDEATVMDVTRLALGETATLRYEAQLVSPRATLRADDGEVRFADGRRRALAARNSVALAPALLAPSVAVTAARRHAQVVVELRNDGWVDARDVRVRIALPALLRLIDGSVTVDAVPAVRGARRGGAEPLFARVESQSGGHAITLAAVPARDVAAVAFTVAFPMGYAGGTIGVACGEHDAAIAVQPQPVRDLRLRVTDVPAGAAPGETVQVVAQVVNAGDVSETVVLAVAGASIEPWRSSPRTLGPGATAFVESAVSVSSQARDGEAAAITVTLEDDAGERARAQTSIVVRDRTRLGADEDPEADAAPAIAHAVLRSSDEVIAGGVLWVELDVDVEDDVDSLVIRAAPVARAEYVAGSSSVGGSLLLDRAAGSPFAGDGLRLRAIPAGTRIACAWSLLAAPAADDEPLLVAAALDVDGDARAVAPISIGLRGRDAFAARPAGRRYHVEGFTVSGTRRPDTGGCDVEPAPSHDEVEDPPMRYRRVFRLRDDAERRAELARLIDGAPACGLVAHVLALRALFPDECVPWDGATADALATLRTTLRDVYDRLFVKLRIPGFVAGADDLEDPPLRRALGALCERLGRYDLVAALSDAAYGSPAALRALVALLPTECDDATLSGALEHFGAVLDEVLAGYLGVAPAIFDDALANAADRALDVARDALRAALQGSRTVLELTC